LICDGPEAQRRRQAVARIECKVTEGLRDAEATVEVKDYSGRSEFLPIDRGFLSTEGKRHYLPVSVIQIDQRNKAALVSLPVEADSGANRIWVRLGALHDYSEAPA
jgi:hypothetical protein